jgi:hypothetical protein
VGVIEIDSGWISAAVGTAVAGAVLMWPEYGRPLGLALLVIAALIFVLGVRIEGFHNRIGRQRRMASSPKGARDEAIKKPTTEQIEARRLLEWKDVPEAIEAFAESSLLKARDKWKEQFEEANENGHDAARALIEPTATASLPFAVVFPADAALDECAKRPNVLTHNHCIDYVQIHYDYDRAMWESLPPGRRQVCITSAETFPMDSRFYQRIEPCLERQVNLQGHETVHRFNH